MKAPEDVTLALLCQERVSNDMLIIQHVPQVVNWREDELDPAQITVVICWSAFTTTVLTFRRDNPQSLEILKQLSTVCEQVAQDIQEVHNATVGSES